MCQKICGGYKRHTDESEDFMRITIFSLGGLLGQYVTNTALLHGAQVTAYVPDAKAIWPRKNLTVIEGSLQNRERVLEALLEADAVISVMTPMRVKHVKEEETPLADGNAMILSAMKQLGKTRFVTVGHVCIHAFGDCEDKYQRMSTKFMQIFVAMTPEETLYFANPGKEENFKPEFYFNREDFRTQANDRRT